MTENPPKITVITVTFNLIKNGREAFFRQCVESVHNQTYPNIEHLIIDGASTDGTLDLIKEYEKKGWLKCYSEPDNGHWNAMNKGAKLATGKYIIYLNSDDYFVDNKNIIKLCIAELEKKGENYKSVCKHYVINKNGSPFFPGNSIIPPAPKELFYRIQTYQHETLICPKKVYEKLGYHNEKYKTAIDYEFNIKLILNGYHQIYIPDCMTAVRLGGCTTDVNCQATSATIDNIFLLYQDIYPWAGFDRTDIENMFIKGIMKDKFIKNIKNKIEALNLKNIDYNIFYNDLNNFKYKTTLKCKLFFIITFLEKRAFSNNEMFFFMKVIPLLRIKRKENTTRVYLFGFIPFLKIKSK